MPPRVTFQGRTIFTDESFQGDSFLSGLGDANVSGFADVAQGIDAGTRTATNIAGFIDEFGPQGQERRRIDLEQRRANLSIAQKNAKLAEIQSQVISSNEDLVRTNALDQLSRQQLENKTAIELGTLRSEFRERLAQIPPGDFIGYGRLRQDPKYSVLATDPEIRRELRQQDAIFGAQAQASGTPDGRQLAQTLGRLDTTATSASLRSQDIAQERNNLTRRAQNIRLQEQGQGGGTGRPQRLTNQQLGAIASASGARNQEQALAAVVSAQLRQNDRGESEFIINNQVVNEIDNPTAFRAIQAGRGFALRRGVTEQPRQLPTGQTQPQQAQPPRTEPTPEEIALAQEREENPLRPVESPETRRNLNNQRERITLSATGISKEDFDRAVDAETDAIIDEIRKRPGANPNRERIREAVRERRIQIIASNASGG